MVVGRTTVEIGTILRVNSWCRGTSTFRWFPTLHNGSFKHYWCLVLPSETMSELFCVGALAWAFLKCVIPPLPMPPTQGHTAKVENHSFTSWEKWEKGESKIGKKREWDLVSGALLGIGHWGDLEESRAEHIPLKQREKVQESNTLNVFHFEWNICEKELLKNPESASFCARHCP